MREWRGWRQSERGALAGGALRLYYVDGRFQRDFPRFLRLHTVAADPMMHMLLRLDEALAPASKSNAGHPLSQEPMRAMVAERRSDFLLASGRVSLPDGCTLLTFPYEVAALHKAIAAGTVPAPCKSFYATRLQEDRQVKLLEITPVLAELLALCDGRSLQSLLEAMAAASPVDVGEHASEFALELLIAAQESGWVQIQRVAPPVHRERQIRSLTKPAVLARN